VSESVLETKRLLIRDLRRDDLDDLATLFGDPETMRFYPRPYRRDEVRAMIDRNPARYSAYGFGLWAVEERSGGGFLGDCGLTIQLVEGIAEVRSPGTWPEPGGGKGSPPRRPPRSGTTPSATRGLRRLIALVRPENEASQGVARKLGMEVEPTGVFHDLPHLVFASTP
jgi:RimJ/RimL family protein N-acetyltransferase